jgi:hypothetical protein
MSDERTEGKDVGAPDRCRDCGCSEGLTFEPDPFSSEIHDDDTPVWLCPTCREDRWLET